MNTQAAILWMLITVTGNGQVHHSLGYPTMHLCKEARSMARYGETLEQATLHEATYERTQAAKEAEAKAAWEGYTAEVQKMPCVPKKPREEYIRMKSGVYATYEKTTKGYCPNLATAGPIEWESSGTVFANWSFGLVPIALLVASVGLLIAAIALAVDVTRRRKS